MAGPRPETTGRLQHDSRKIGQGDIFIAIRGLTSDGHHYIEQAVESGASVIVSEEPASGEELSYLHLQVVKTRPLLGRIAQALQENPADKLTTIAVTGTNGKTTTATLIWQALMQLGESAGLLGTVAKQFGKRREESRLTTADPVELADDMRRMVDAGCRYLSMEVSSHALDQERVEGIHWNLALFTNLSHDHIDYHSSLEAYIEAKKKLFDSLGKQAIAIVNADDTHSRAMIRDCSARTVEYGFHPGVSTRCKLDQLNEKGTVFQVDSIRIESPLVGRFNAYNVAGAFLACRELGFEPDEVAAALKHCNGAPGRLESVQLSGDDEKGPAVFVDYAHTPDALENVASTLSRLSGADRPLTILFGCGGDRDREKRSRMAEIAERYGDSIVVTSDNPRNEDPAAIIREIETGFSDHAKWTTRISREEAILHVIKEAPENSLVLIAGKGHETYQEFESGRRIHFDDREVARRALKARRNVNQADGGN